MNWPNFLKKNLKFCPILCAFFAHNNNLNNINQQQFRWGTTHPSDKEENAERKSQNLYKLEVPKKERHRKKGVALGDDGNFMKSRYNSCPVMV